MENGLEFLTDRHFRLNEKFGPGSGRKSSLFLSHIGSQTGKWEIPGITTRSRQESDARRAAVSTQPCPEGCKLLPGGLRSLPNPAQRAGIPAPNARRRLPGGPQIPPHMLITALCAEQHILRKKWADRRLICAQNAYRTHILRIKPGSGAGSSPKEI